MFSFLVDFRVNLSSQSRTTEAYRSHPCLSINMTMSGYFRVVVNRTLVQDFFLCDEENMDFHIENPSFFRGFRSKEAFCSTSECIMQYP